MTAVRLEPVAPRSRDKHFTTEPLHFYLMNDTRQIIQGITKELYKLKFSQKVHYETAHEFLVLTGESSKGSKY